MTSLAGKEPRPPKDWTPTLPPRVVMDLEAELLPLATDTAPTPRIDGLLRARTGLLPRFNSTTDGHYGREHVKTANFPLPFIRCLGRWNIVNDALTLFGRGRYASPLRRCGIANADDRGTGQISWISG